MPVGVLQQDWGAALGDDAAAVWRVWAPLLDHRTTTSGEDMSGQACQEILALLDDVL